MARTWIVKAGGEMMASDKIRKKILSHLVRMNRKNPVLFVHGGGPQIEAELIRAKVPVKYSGGRRVTSGKAMAIVESVLSGRINKSITAQLSRLKVPALGLSGRDAALMTARPRPGMGRAGRPVKVNTGPIESLLRAGFLPVLSSVASDSRGAALNVNADDFASALACALQASKLIYLTDIAGVLDKGKKRIPVLKIRDIAALIKDGTITGGMIPKVQSARDAILKGVGEIDIVDGSKGIDLRQGTKICA